MKPSPYRLEVRRRRLQNQKAWEQKEMNSRFFLNICSLTFVFRKFLLQETGDSNYAVLTGLIQNTYKGSIKFNFFRFKLSGGKVTVIYR